jgi:hypothetical protein
MYKTISLVAAALSLCLAGCGKQKDVAQTANEETADAAADVAANNANVDAGTSVNPPAQAGH